MATAIVAHGGLRLACILRKNRDSQGLRTTAKSGRYRDRTCDPFRVKEDSDGSNSIASKEVTSIIDPSCTTACTKSAESGVSGTVEPVTGTALNHFAAALMMIAGLPLPDADKAETVKRLLAQGQP